MATVIQLPRDERGAEIGSAIADSIGQIINAKMKVQRAEETQKVLSGAVKTQDHVEAMAFLIENSSPQQLQDQDYLKSTTDFINSTFGGPPDLNQSEALAASLIEVMARIEANRAEGALDREADADKTTEVIEGAQERTETITEQRAESDAAQLKLQGELETSKEGGRNARAVLGSNTAIRVAEIRAEQAAQTAAASGSPSAFAEKGDAILRARNIDPETADPSLRARAGLVEGNRALVTSNIKAMMGNLSSEFNIQIDETKLAGFTRAGGMVDDALLANQSVSGASSDVLTRGLVEVAKAETKGQISQGDVEKAPSAEALASLIDGATVQDIPDIIKLIGIAEKIHSGDPGSVGGEIQVLTHPELPGMRLTARRVGNRWVPLILEKS